jgi:hypothetical protein
MKIVSFPGRGDAESEAARHAELEAALNGEGQGAAADFWRELRTDVRALAPPPTPEFERQLRERLADRAVRPPRPLATWQRAPAGAASVPPTTARRLGRGRGHATPRRSLGWARGLLATGPRRAAVTLTTLAAVVLAVLIAGPLRTGNRPIGEAVPPGSTGIVRPDVSAPAAPTHAEHGTAAPGAAGTADGGLANAAPAGAQASASGARASASGARASASGGRVQQRAASIDLSAAPSEVQAVADRVARIAASLGGYVQSSQVNVQAQVQEAGASRAELDLRLPSTKLGGALATLGELAPVRSESQSLQDITHTYDTAQRRLGDAIAERRALLRALAAAATESQVESLRARLAQARRAIAEAQSAFQAVSQLASASEVEVEVIGDRHAAGEGLTLRRGLRDAGKVLVATLTVLLIASATLVPLTLVVVAFAAARRRWRRIQRERVLDAR